LPEYVANSIDLRCQGRRSGRAGAPALHGEIEELERERIDVGADGTARRATTW
jgi:hypothetical protein